MGGFGCLYTRRMEWRWAGWAAAAAAASAGATPSFAGQPHKFLANTNRQERSGAAAAGCILATRPTRIVRLHISAASR